MRRPRQWDQVRSALGEEYALTLRTLRLRASHRKRTEAVAERRREIVRVLKDHPTTTTTELAERFGVGVRTVERDRRALAELLESGRPCPICGARMADAAPSKGR